MQSRHWLLTVSGLIAVSALLAGGSSAKPPANGEPDEDVTFEDTSPDYPLPHGVKERVFIHVPRTHRPGHLGTCSPTTNAGAGATDFGLAGWRLPTGGITWKLNLSTVPTTVGSSNALIALSAAFATWTAADPNSNFFYGNTTKVTRPQYDGVNAVLWGKISAGAIAITYVRYYTGTGVIADIDTVFNSKYPWAVFNSANGECQTTPDAYDVQNIATHEFGHWVGLDDLYSSFDRDLTMYGYGAGGELKKRTLGAGDIKGAIAVGP